MNGNKNNSPNPGQSSAGSPNSFYVCVVCWRLFSNEIAGRIHVRDAQGFSDDREKKQVDFVYYKGTYRATSTYYKCQG